MANPVPSIACIPYGHQQLHFLQSSLLTTRKNGGGRPRAWNPVPNWEIVSSFLAPGFNTALLTAINWEMKQLMVMCFSMSLSLHNCLPNKNFKNILIKIRIFIEVIHKVRICILEAFQDVLCNFENMQILL